MRKLLAVFLFITLTVPPVDALPPRVTKAPETPAPAAPKADGTGTPKRSFLERLMNPTPIPTPTPTPSPTPVAKHRPRKPVAPGEAETQKPAVPAVVATPTVTAKSSAGKGTTKTASKPAPKDKSDLSGLDDSTKYKVVKAKALEDSQVKELKAKADSEVDEADARKALDAYNRALFRKIREIEPSLDGYVDKIESSMTRRLTAEKGKQ